MSILPKNHIKFLNQSFMVEDLINPVDFSWNIDLLNSYIHPDDINIIRGLAVSSLSAIVLIFNLNNKI